MKSGDELILWPVETKQHSRVGYKRNVLFSGKVRKLFKSKGFQMRLMQYVVIGSRKIFL